MAEHPHFYEKDAPYPLPGRAGAPGARSFPAGHERKTLGTGPAHSAFLTPCSRPGRPPTPGLNPPDPAASARAQQPPAAQGAASLSAAPLPARPLSQEGRGVGGAGPARAVLGLVGLAACALPPPIEAQSRKGKLRPGEGIQRAQDRAAARWPPSLAQQL